MQYLHKDENKGKKIKVKETNSDIHKGVDAPLNLPNSHDVEKEPIVTSENKNHENESDMEEETSRNDDIIVKLLTKSDTLENENDELKKQLEKLTRVIVNMNNALKSQS